MDQRTIPENILKHNSVQGRTEVMASELGRLAARAQDAEERARLAESQAAELREEVERLKNWDVRCMDCSRPYPHGLDMVLTLKQWKLIHPDRGGVLCPSCLVNRAAHMKGSISVYAHIVFSEHEKDGDALERIVEALRLENADYCAKNGDLEHENATLRAQVGQLTKERDSYKRGIEAHAKEANELEAALERRHRAVTDEEWDNRPSVEAGPSYWPRLITAILASRSREQEPGK